MGKPVIRPMVWPEFKAPLMHYDPANDVLRQAIANSVRYHREEAAKLSFPDAKLDRQVQFESHQRQATALMKALERTAETSPAAT